MFGSLLLEVTVDPFNSFIDLNEMGECFLAYPRLRAVELDSLLINKGEDFNCFVIGAFTILILFAAVDDWVVDSLDASEMLFEVGFLSSPSVIFKPNQLFSY